MHYSPVAARTGTSPHRRLRRLFAARIGPTLTIGDSRARDWASASFCGERHHFDCWAQTPFDIADLRAALVVAEWRIPGHIVADVTVEPRSGETGRCGATIEILTVID